jgi:hypothetical protein
VAENPEREPLPHELVLTLAVKHRKTPKIVLNEPAGRGQPRPACLGNSVAHGGNDEWMISLSQNTSIGAEKYIDRILNRTLGKVALRVGFTASFVLDKIDYPTQ